MKKFMVAILIVAAFIAGFYVGNIQGSSQVAESNNSQAKVEKPFVKFKDHHENLDSILQVTKEQKKSLELGRQKGDSTFKILKGKKQNAEKILAESIEAEDSLAIENAKILVLELEKEMLNQRVNGMKEFSKILTKDQMKKFNDFIKKNRQKRHPIKNQLGNI